MADLTLPYLEQKNAVLLDRWPASAPIPQWLAAAYTDLWNSADWTFKRVSGEAWWTTGDGTSTGAATATPLMPDTVGEVLSVFDDVGLELQHLAEHEYEHAYMGATDVGVPDTYTVIGRQIHLFPAPDQAFQFSLSYRRRLCTRTTAGVFQAGFYQDDADIPAWDDHHYILVVRARMLAARVYSDPTADELEVEYQRLWEAMFRDYGPRIPRGEQLPAWR